MPPDLHLILSYTFIPAFAIIAGGSAAIFYVPSQKTRSMVQHFAAGVVFSAVAVELLPEITREGALIPLILGFAFGTGTMLAVNQAIARIEAGATHTRDRRSVAGLVIGVAIFFSSALPRRRVCGAQARRAARR